MRRLKKDSGKLCYKVYFSLSVGITLVRSQKRAPPPTLFLVFFSFGKCRVLDMCLRNAMKRTNLAGRVSSLTGTQKVMQKHLWACTSPVPVRVGEGTSVWNINGSPSGMTLPIVLGCIKQQPHCPRLHGPYQEVRIL